MRHRERQGVEDRHPAVLALPEAFLYTNTDWVIAKGATFASSSQALVAASADDLRGRAYAISIEDLEKVDFALDLMLAEGWQAPKYIAEGLKWLAEQTS